MFYLLSAFGLSSSSSLSKSSSIPHGKTITGSLTASGCPFLAASATTNFKHINPSPESPPTSSSPSPSSSRKVLARTFDKPRDLTDDEKAIITSTVPVLATSGVALLKHFYARMFGAHPELKNVFNHTADVMGTQAATLAYAVHAYAANINDLTPIAGYVKHIAHVHCTCMITPEQYDIVGEHLIGSIKEVLSLPHEHKIVQAWIAAYNSLAYIFKTMEAEIYAEQYNNSNESNGEHVGWYGYREFQISNVVKESDEIVSIYMKPKDGIYPLPKPKPGQYIGIRVYLKHLNLLQIRQYTISQSTDRIYRISVKIEPPTHPDAQSGVSSYIHSLKVNDTVFITPPVGDFGDNFNENKSKSPLVFISTGVGIGPLLTMACDAIASGNNHITFIHGARNSSKLFKSAINYLLQNHGYAVKPKLFFSKPLESDKVGIDYDYNSRIKLNLLDPKENYLDNNNSHYYLCAPQSAMHDFKQQLINQFNVKPENIHAHLFGKGNEQAV